MLKQLSFVSTGRRADIGTHQIFRVLPNRYALAVGSFVFLDYFPNLQEFNETSMQSDGTGEHPHRGIATLTYLLSGAAEHKDSLGNQAVVFSGGAQWMNAGNGIIHNEKIFIDPNNPLLFPHGFQFWINLPAVFKSKSPEYIYLQDSDIPRKKLPEDAGYLKVIVGDYLEAKSLIPQYLPHFLYHIQLNKGKSWSIFIPNDLEVAIFLVNSHILVNNQLLKMAEFAEFDRNSGEIIIENQSSENIDVLLFGGESYTEPIVAEGPFVMNTHAEIALAYREYMAGKYGEIK